MFIDIRTVVRDLAVFKLNYILEEFNGRDSPIPDKLDFGDESDLEILFDKP